MLIIYPSDSKKVTIIKSATPETPRLIRLTEPQKVLLTKISNSKNKIRKARETLSKTNAPPTGAGRLAEEEWTRSSEKVRQSILALNASAAQIVNLTGSDETDQTEEKVSSIVEAMCTTLEDLAASMLVITSTMEDDEAARDALDKLFEGVEIFFNSTSPELERNNEVRSCCVERVFLIYIISLLFSTSFIFKIFSLFIFRLGQS